MNFFGDSSRDTSNRLHSVSFKASVNDVYFNRFEQIFSLHLNKINSIKRAVRLNNQLSTNYDVRHLLVSILFQIWFEQVQFETRNRFSMRNRSIYVVSKQFFRVKFFEFQKHQF